MTAIFERVSLAFALCVSLLLPACVGAQPAATPPTAGLTWDSEMKDFTPDAGATNFVFGFAFTNNTKDTIVISGVKPSCGCTAVSTQPLPWSVAPGSNAAISATIDLRGKFGVLMKSITVDSSAGPKALIVKINLPQPPALSTGAGPISDRMRNQLLTQADRQVVFRGDCARCHVEPAKGKMGAELFAAACAICHDTPHRATMVPDLRALNKPTDENYWKVWTMFGKVASLMPGFAQNQGGPLTDAQIDSLAKWLAEGGLTKTAKTAQKQ
ncbi:MAG: DUF1573 domain-containing protein [Verrucomicrobia bacterium]|nr:DUF1573 domain-containing protein [Verrucomicrobiota bacterium]